MANIQLMLHSYKKKRDYCGHETISTFMYTMDQITSSMLMNYWTRDYINKKHLCTLTLRGWFSGFWGIMIFMRSWIQNLLPASWGHSHGISSCNNLVCEMGRLHMLERIVWLEEVWIPLFIKKKKKKKKKKPNLITIIEHEYKLYI